MHHTLIAVASLAVTLVACGKTDEKRTRQSAEPSASATTSASAALPREPPAGWSLLKPAGGGYSVFVPGVPEKIEGGLSMIYGVKRPSGYVYTAMCMTTKEPKEAFEGMRRGKIGDRKVRASVPLEDARGKGERLEIEMETDKGLLIVNELLLVGKDRVCSFTALVPARVDEKADLDRFFDSARFED